MAVSTETPAGIAAVRSFTIPVTPETEFESLRARIAATRWPDPELVADFSQGVQQSVAVGFFDVKNVSVPAAVSTFAHEIYKVPRSWAERAYPNLIYFHELDQGNHFAAWQEPGLFAAELRAGFRSLR